jgi:hemerythrin-like domain-containing protein
MHSILQELHQDHLNLSRILTLLQKQLDLIAGGEAVDVLVLGEIVDYVRSYPDLVHHPREDVIFGVYRQRCGDHADLIERLMAEHKALVASTVDLQSCVTQWTHDSPVPRDQIVGRLTDYIRRQWDHLNLEEGSVYKLLAEGLADADWLDIEAALPQGTDPLFGDQLQRRYEHIFGQVMSFA